MLLKEPFKVPCTTLKQCFLIKTNSTLDSSGVVLHLPVEPLFGRLMIKLTYTTHLECTKNHDSLAKFQRQVLGIRVLGIKSIHNLEFVLHIYPEGSHLPKSVLLRSKEPLTIQGTLEEHVDVTVKFPTRVKL